MLRFRISGAIPRLPQCLYGLHRDQFTFYNEYLKCGRKQSLHDWDTVLAFTLNIKNDENLFGQDSVTAEFRTGHLHSQVLRLKSILLANKVKPVFRSAGLLLSKPSRCHHRSTFLNGLPAAWMKNRLLWCWQLSTSVWRTVRVIFTVHLLA